MIFLNNHVLGISRRIFRGSAQKILPTLFIWQGKHRSLGLVIDDREIGQDKW